MSQILELSQSQPFVMRSDGVEYNVTYPVTAIAKLEMTFPKATERYRAAVAEMQQRAANALVPEQAASADEVRA